MEGVPGQIGVDGIFLFELSSNQMSLHLMILWVLNLVKLNGLFFYSKWH